MNALLTPALAAAKVSLAMSFIEKIATDGPPVWLIVAFVAVIVVVPTLFSLLRMRKHLMSAFGVEEKLGPDAQLGIGQITGVEPTGTLINDVRVYKIHMAVRGQNYEEFSGVLKRPVYEHEIAMMSEGTVLPVAYRPKKREELSMVPESKMAEANALLQQQRVAMGVADPRDESIFQQGTTVQGVVTTLKPTGEIRHGHNGVMIGVSFARQDAPGSFIEREKHGYLLPTTMSQMTVGKHVGVTYLPYDDSQFVITSSVN
ncbi:hypothetical protein [Brevibacterium otitidis]|uniref:Uncharacterized protein n=1 Tax=Brevibacterium otitidis TaxID=53364 RepID=A0ABV5X3P7_9MICO